LAWNSLLKHFAIDFHEVSQRGRRFSPVLAVIVVALPIILYIWYVAQYGENVPRWDDWEIVPIASASINGELTSSMLWAQHNENRMLVPYVIDLAFTRATNLDFHVMMFFSALLEILSYALLAWTYFRGRRFTIWALVPVAYIGLSLAQHESTLWGFQVAWYLVSFCLASTLYCLITIEENKRLKKFCAVGAAVVGSFCSFQGLLIWPAGLLVILFQGNGRRWAVQWVVAALATLAVYFMGFNFAQTGGAPITDALERPDLLAFFLVLIGSVSVGGAPSASWAYACFAVTGLLLLAISIFVLGRGLRGRPDPQLALASALIVFTLLFDASVCLGRGSSGLVAATASRYTTYNLLLLLGNYFGLLTLFRLSSRARVQGLKVIARLFAVLILIQVVLSDGFGLPAGEISRGSALQAAEATIHFTDASPNLVLTYVYPDTRIFRAYAALARRDKLSTFARLGGCSGFQVGAISVPAFPDVTVNQRLTASGSLALYLSDHPRASAAWGALTELYAKHSDLAVSYPVWGITFPASLLAWAGSEGSGAHDRALAGFSSEYQRMFNVAKGSLARRHHSEDIQGVILPAPSVLTPIFLDDPNAVEAWHVLSILYFERADLVRTFPGVAVDFPSEYIGWATESSESPDVDGTGSLLRPYATQLKAMQSALATAKFEQQEKETREQVLPIPPSLHALVTSDAATYAAWMLVSNAYRRNQSLEGSVPKQSPCFSSDLLKWASRAGGSSEPLLHLYKKQLVAIRDALEY
jgi:hypothetical protein